MCKFDARGHEILDQEPIAAPVNIHRAATIADLKSRYQLARTNLEYIRQMYGAPPDSVTDDEPDDFVSNDDEYILDPPERSAMEYEARLAEAAEAQKAQEEAQNSQASPPPVSDPSE